VQKLLFSLFSLTLIGCASNATAPPRVPDAEDEPAASRAEPATAAKNEKPVPPPLKVPDPPALCDEFTQRQTTQCGPSTARDLLAEAVATADASARDAKLVCLEKDQGLPKGIVRALRADLAPEVCADAIVAPFLEAETKLAPDVEQALIGLLLSGKLARLGANPPDLEAPFDKQRFLSFFESDLKPWILGQAAAIGDLSLQGSKLNGYGKAVAALAAGAADLRFVDLARAVPLPEEMKKDPEVRDVYYATLDEALEPRKQRGRDAALVGLRLFAQLGVLHDERVLRARALLGKLYGGARVDALDLLLLPKLPAPALDTADRKLAAGLPTYYTLVLFPDLDPTDPGNLRALATRGLPPPHRKRLDQGKLPPAANKLYARALLDSGVLYFRAADFKRAAEVAAGGTQDDDTRLVAAVARGLEAGPADAADLMLKGQPTTGLGTLAELDTLAKGKTKTSGMASFDSAYILELVPRRDDPSFWEDVGARYERASKQLTDPKDKERAAEYAAQARSTAKSLSAQPKASPGKS
jgi:hypothetical protein